MKLPRVSIIIPTLNEEKFIEQAIRSIIENDYPKEKLEIIVVDGQSDDRTVEIVESLRREFPNLIRIIPNPKKITPVALNIGIKNATGDIIIRMDAHSRYPKDYISKCVRYLVESDADNVGGIFKIVPRSSGKKAIAIARVLSSKIGTGGAKYRNPPKIPMEVDTVPFGCFKRSIFEKYGLFNERLVRNQDIEYNIRIKTKGGTVILFPDIIIEYFARDTYKDLWKNNFLNGFWVIESLKYSKIPFRLRHIVPLFFLLFLIIGGIISTFVRSFFLFYLILILLYIFVITLASINIAIKEKSLIMFFYSFAAFLVLHFSYGFGSLWAVMRFFKKRKTDTYY